MCMHAKTEAPNSKMAKGMSSRVGMLWQGVQDHHLCIKPNCHVLVCTRGSAGDQALRRSTIQGRVVGKRPSALCVISHMLQTS